MTKPKVTVPLTSDNQFTSAISDVSVQLQAIERAVEQFKQLPCYNLLLQVSASLSVSLFIDSPKNTNPLKNSRKLFLASKFDCDLVSIIATMPAIIQAPELSDEDLDDIDKQLAWKLAMREYKNSNASTHNAPIIALQRMIKDDAIITRYNNLQRVLSFLDGKDDSQFILPIWERDIVSSLSQVSKEVKNLFIACHQNAFLYDPTVTKHVTVKGEIVSSTVLHTFDVSVANFSNYASICQIIAGLKAVDGTKKDCSFFANGLNSFLDLYSKRVDFDVFVLCIFMRKFDSNTGSKQNLDQTTASFKDLF